MDRKYVFIKDWKTPDGVIPAGSDLTLVHGCVYFNGGLQSQYYAAQFMKLINLEEKSGFNYLKPVQLIYNKC